MFDEIKIIKFKGKSYEQYHGSPFDRGSADSWYHRSPQPHKGGVGGNSGPRVTDLTPAEVEAYHAGYDHNEQFGGKKEWN
jgi:hypothetical protein